MDAVPYVPTLVGVERLVRDTITRTLRASQEQRDSARDELERAPGGTEYARVAHLVHTRFVGVVEGVEAVDRAVREVLGEDYGRAPSDGVPRAL